MISKILAIIVTLVGLAFCQQPDGQCSSKWQLSNLIQTTNVLRITASADRINENFNYPFGASYFDTKPTSILTISDYQCQDFGDIDFSVTPFVNDTILTIIFQSDGMKWIQLTTVVWLTSRPDMITGLIITDQLNIGSLQNKIFTVNTTAPVKFYQDTRTWYLNYITGMRAKSNSGIFDVNTSAFSKTQNTYTLEVTASEDTNLQAIQITYIVFNLQISLFSSGGGFESESNLLQPVYKKVHKNFVPVNYRMLGFDKLKIENGKRFELHLDIDTDYILQAQSRTGIDYIRVVFLTIGQKTNKVCDECNNFIFQEQCVDSCPSFSYPFLGYINGGKSCLTCSPKVNEELNQLRTGCQCLSKYVRNGTGSCILDNTTKSVVSGNDTLNPNEVDRCGQNKSFVNGECVCNSKSILLDGGICFQCVPGSYKSDNNCLPCVKNCISCINGNSCTECINSFSYNTQVNECLDSTTVVIIPPVQSCGDNKTLINGQCVCDSGSILLDGGLCFKCVPGSYKEGQNCLPCVRNCISCQNSDSCLECSDNFIFNEENNECIDSSVVTTPVSNCGQNKTLVNEECVCDNDSILLDNGVCFKCIPGSFKEGSNCLPCVRDCISCQNGQFCKQCVQNFTFNEELRQCVISTVVVIPPTNNCGENKTFSSVDQACICDNSSIPLTGGVCFKCVSGSFREASNCLPCIDQCISCQSNETCEQCFDEYTFNSLSKKCELKQTESDCKEGQIFQNDLCVCDEFSIRLNGICFKCEQGTYKSIQNCLPCVKNCISCVDGQTCNKCEDTFFFNPVTKSCDNTSVSSETDFAFCNPTLNKTLNRQLNKCQCLTSFVDVSGKCQCPNNFALNKETNLCQEDKTNTVKNQTTVLPPTQQCGVQQVFDGQKCVFCQNGTYPNQLQKKCSFCIDKCTYCTGSVQCLRCTQGYQFNPQTLSCQFIKECSQNQILSNGDCICDEFSGLVDDKCVKCDQGTFKSSENTCNACPVNCLSCSNQDICSSCIQSYALNQQTKKCELQCKSADHKQISEAQNKCQCLPTFVERNGNCECPPSLVLSEEENKCVGVCGNSIKEKNEGCDDGNQVAGDGCFNCIVEVGFGCTDGVCKKLKLYVEDSKIISNGLITTFKTEDPIEQQNLNQDFTINLGEGSPKPKNTRIIQPNGDKNKIKVFMEYCILPPKQVEVTYSVNEGDVTVNYDLNNKKITTN